MFTTPVSESKHNNKTNYFIFAEKKNYKRYDSRAGARYDPNLDINGDGKIDIYDVVIACTYYGQRHT